MWVGESNNIDGINSHMRYKPIPYIRTLIYPYMYLGRLLIMMGNCTQFDVNAAIL
mgnify:CR=1 FL=1